MRGKLDRLFFGVVMLGAIWSLSTFTAKAQSIEQKAQVCAGCHGADGKPIDKAFPIIWDRKRVTFTSNCAISSGRPQERHHATDRFIVGTR